jgi:uncharacterized membrane protein YeaQ/YmgE (transglycosylase-associated protein family)
MDLLVFVILGLAAGVLARMVVHARGEPGGFGESLVVGVLGAVLGGLLGRALGLYETGAGEGFLTALASAVLLLLGYHAAALRRMV